MRLVLACALVLAGLTGCASSEAASLWNASQAVEEARRHADGGVVVSVEGAEGPPLRGPWADLAFTGDDVPDGTIGDGRLSSWTVSFAVADALRQVQVFADGRAPVVVLRPLPEYLLDQVGSPPVAPDALDSRAMADVAALHPEFPEGAGSVLYSFSWVTRDLYNRSDALLEADERPAEALGYSSVAGKWTITRFDSVWAGSGPGRAIEATLDPYPPEVEAVASFFPVWQTRILLEDQTFSEPRLEGTGANVLTFDVAEGTKRLEGAFHARTATAGQWGTAWPALRLTDPTGTVRYEGPGQYGLELLELEEAPPGTWTLEVSDNSPVPGTIQVHAFLWAVISAGSPGLRA